MSKKREEPRMEVTRTKPLAELDDRAQERARTLRTKYGWTLYTFRDGGPEGRWIVSANLPFSDDTRDWHVVTFPEGDAP